LSKYGTSRKPSIGGIAAAPPVSMTTTGARTATPLPSSVRSAMNDASARTISTPAPSSRIRVAMLQAATMPRTRSITNGKSSVTSPSKPSARARRARPTLCAAARNALDGVQPVLIQVPPNLPRSKRTTCLPSFASAIASGTPP
jgi:hypothetical protein